jgi:hypothetical protein
MKYVCSVVFVILALPLLDAGLTLAAEGQTDEAAITYGAGLTANSRYLWRGIVIDEYPVFQPSAWIAGYGFELDGWSDFALPNPETRFRCEELDFTLSYSAELAGLSLEPQAAAYVFPGATPSSPTGELSVRLSYPLGPVELSTSHSVDVLLTPGAYFGDLHLTFTHPLAASLLLAADIGTGWASSRFNEANLGVAQSAWNTAGGELALEWQPWGILTLRPHLDADVLVDRDLRSNNPSSSVLSFGLDIEKDF